VDDKDFKKVLIKAGIELPKGQSTHVMRHTFAVHFMLNRGNILDLQKILGHKTLQMTLRYAGYHPDYLQDALTKNPLATL
jgi:site-specific recombinase XerD